MVDNTNRDNFIVQAAQTAALETLLERTVFLVSQESYVEFLALLDDPAEPNERLLKTLQSTTPWE